MQTNEGDDNGVTIVHPRGRELRDTLINAGELSCMAKSAIIVRKAVTKMPKSRVPALKLGCGSTEIESHDQNYRYYVIGSAPARKSSLNFKLSHSHMSLGYNLLIDQ